MFARVREAGQDFIAVLLSILKKTRMGGNELLQILADVFNMNELRGGRLGGERNCIEKRNVDPQLTSFDRPRLLRIHLCSSADSHSEVLKFLEVTVATPSAVAIVI
jgi:hypothetical protein